VETGKWPNWAELPAGHLTFARFFEDYGRVLQNRHDAAKAEAALADLKSDRDIIAANYPKEEPDDDQALPWVDRAVAQGEAVVRLAKGDTEGGLKLQRKAAEAEASVRDITTARRLLEAGAQSAGGFGLLLILRRLSPPSKKISEFSTRRSAMAVAMVVL
jgi:hypothetical protein